MKTLKSAVTALALLACGAVFAAEPVNINTASWRRAAIS
jgi:hypothetical protein